MKKPKGICLLLIVVLVSLSCSERKRDYSTVNPNVTTQHRGFSLLYNEQHEQADWVAYELTAEETEGTFNRTEDFREDPSITTGSATLEDYKYSGYDRGHLIPAGDMQWSEEAMSASFFLSNMSPQDPGFNRGEWRMLESKVREWARTNQRVQVVTGPALRQGIIKAVGPNRVSVPSYYFKVVLDNKEPELKGIGFIMPNRSISGDLKDYAVAIDSVESFTGFEFYSTLSDSLENALESKFHMGKWNLRE